MTRAEALAHIADELARYAADNAPDRWWCPRCLSHRTDGVGVLCPCCQGEAR